MAIKSYSDLKLRRKPKTLSVKSPKQYILGHMHSRAIWLSTWVGRIYILSTKSSSERCCSGITWPEQIPISDHLKMDGRVDWNQKIKKASPINADRTSILCRTWPFLCVPLIHRISSHGGIGNPLWRVTVNLHAHHMTYWLKAFEVGQKSWKLTRYVFSISTDASHCMVNHAPCIGSAPCIGYLGLPWTIK